METVSAFTSGIERELGMFPTSLMSKEIYMILRTLKPVSNGLRGTFLDFQALIRKIPNRWKFVCVTAQSTQWGHVERGQFT